MNTLPPSSQLSPTETECPLNVGTAIATNVNSRSCSRCGSVSSNKSASSCKNIAGGHSACHELTNNDQISTAVATHQCCGGSGGYTADSDAEQYFVNNVSHRSSMTHLPNDLVSYGSYSSLSHRSRTPVQSDGSGHSRHSHHHNSHGHQYHYQQHHTTCKKVALPGRGHYRHRRKSSSSTLPDSIHRRSDMDGGSSGGSAGVRGSESCIYEPLHVDVSSPSTATNTVILTPSKITIERSQAEQMEQMARDTSSSDLPEYMYSESPIKWSFPVDREGKKRPNDTDYIEVLSEPECSSQDEKVASKCSYDSKTISVWRTDNEETTNTIIFHHESEVVENCCDNYYFHCKADNEFENCSAELCDFISKNNIEMENMEVPEDAEPLKPTESLNNAVPLNGQSSAPLINFQKNNISTVSNRLDLSPEIRRYSKSTNLQQHNATNLTPHHFPIATLNNSSATQNGNNTLNQNLGCNYFADDKFVNTSTINRGDVATTSSQTPQPSHSSTSHHHSPGGLPQINSESSSYLQTLQTTNQSGFELFNISNSTLYEKPFGSINLTTQNQFEPFSNRRQSINNNNETGDGMQANRSMQNGHPHDGTMERLDSTTNDGDHVSQRYPPP